MNKEQTKKAAAIMLAWAEGKEIEVRGSASSPALWRPMSELSPVWNWSANAYRIKPAKVLIRHFKDRAGTVFCALKNFSERETELTESLERDMDDCQWLDDWHEASFGPLEE